MTVSTTEAPALAKGELAGWSGGYKPMIYAEALASVLETVLNSDSADELTDEQHEFLAAVLNLSRQLEQSFQKPRTS